MIKKISQNNIIIVSTFFLMLVSFAYLSYRETKLADINSQNIWILYFENPKNDSPNFTIENHSLTTNFHWTILADKDEIKAGDTAIPNGQSKTITANILDITDKKITISVTDEENKKKEIYKSF